MFLAIRELRFARTRFVLLGAVVALISTLLVMLTGLTAGLASQSVSAVRDVDADRVVFSTGEGASPNFTESALSADQLEKWKRAPGVTSVSPMAILQGKAESADSTSVNVSAFAVSGEKTPQGVSTDSTVISQTIADDLKVAAGDTISLFGSNYRVDRVVANESYSHTPVMWIPLDAWQEVTGTDAAASVLLVDTVPDADPIVAGTEALTPSAAESAVPSFKSENGSLVLMQVVLYGVSSLVVLSFVSLWTLQRSRDLAVLRALGASRGFLLRDSLIQAAVVLIVGAGLGAVLGWLLGLGAAAVVPLELGGATVTLVVCGLVGLGLVGSALALSRIRKTNPMQALASN